MFTQIKAIATFSLLGFAAGESWDEWTCSSYESIVTVPTTAVSTPVQLFPTSQTTYSTAASTLVPTVTGVIENPSTTSVTTTSTIILINATPTAETEQNSTCVSLGSGADCSSIPVLPETASSPNATKFATTSGFTFVNTVDVSPLPTTTPAAPTITEPSFSTGAAGRHLPPKFPLLSQPSLWSSSKLGTAILAMVVFPAIEVVF